MSVEETRTMCRAIRTSDERLLTLSVDFDGRHGVELPEDPADGRFTSVAAEIAAFYRAAGAP